MPYGKILVLAGFLATVLALQPLEPVRGADEAITADEKLLEANSLKHDGASLLSFFRARTLSDEDRQKLELKVKHLGSKVYRERVKAAQDLIKAGPAALPFLRAALTDPDLEVKDRAAKCIGKIEGGPGPGLPAAAARLLVHRKPSGASQALLNYLPYADDEWLEDEVTSCLGQIAIQDGKVDPVLTKALTDKLAAKRGAAAYVLGRMGDLSQRAAVRKLLGDIEAVVRLKASYGLVGRDVLRSSEDSLLADETLLKEHKIGVDGPGLLAFFRKRTLSEADQIRYQQMVKDLGNKSYRIRVKATRELISLGSSGLPFLRTGVLSADLEIVNRAEACIKKIEAGPGSALPASAVRLLQKKSPPESLETLLAYVPFSDDEAVEEEVLNALCALSAKDVKINPALLAAVRDDLPLRRGAAAFVLGRVGTKDDCNKAYELLSDVDPRVKMRAAQGFLAAKDKSAVPVLLAMLEKAPSTALALQAEDMLMRLASEDAPAVTVGEGTNESRSKARAAWTTWWKKNESKIQLARLNNQSENYQGLRVICEFDWNGKWNGGRVSECGRDGKERWKIENLLGPMDAHVLPNGNVLVAENHGRKVTEYDRKGNKKWEKALNGNPVSVQRMPNGNTFIACYYNYMEVKKDGTEVYNHARTPNSYIFSAQKKKNGNLVIMTSTGAVEELNPVTNKLIKSVTVPTFGNWSSAEGLRNGRYLVALMSQGLIQEIDSAGKVHWKATLTGVHHATRLPNGNTLVACMNNRIVAEFDRSGKEVWRKTTAGRPWRVRYR